MLIETKYLLHRSIFRSVYKRTETNLDVKDVSEEGFKFLSERSEFWRTHKPIYATPAAKKKEKDSNGKKKIRSAGQRVRHL